MKAIVLDEFGGTEQLHLRERTLPAPGPGQALVEVAAAGVNFMDVGTRKGLFVLGAFPLTPGVEGAGRILAVGGGVTEFRVGDRVAWFFIPGSYAQQLIAPIEALVALPDAINFEPSASLMMQGLTASHFATETYAIKPGAIALVHAAAGGVGQLLTQVIKILGGRVIGRVSNPEKVAVARAAGADEVVVNSDGQGFADEVRRLSGGEGVHVVYDGTGADSFDSSLASLRPHGVMAYYGHTIKRLPPIDLLDLPKSVLVSYPTVGDHVRTRAALLARTNQLFAWYLAGKLTVHIGQRFPLAAAADAHDALESRHTTGKLLLIP